MTIQTLLEISDRFDVYVKQLGEGTAMFLVSGSTTTNPAFIVKLKHSGLVRQVSQVDLVIYGDPGDGEPLVPEIPKDWLKPCKKSE